MYCHHCNREPCECVAGTYAASTNMTPPSTNPQVNEDRICALAIIDAYCRQLQTNEAANATSIITAYRHRLISQFADTIQRQKDALRVAEKALKQINHDFILRVSPNSANLYKEALALIQPLL